jgi:hypothetical protein
LIDVYKYVYLDGRGLLESIESDNPLESETVPGSASPEKDPKSETAPASAQSEKEAFLSEVRLKWIRSAQSVAHFKN